MDYDVFYKGMIIGNVQAVCLAEALVIAQLVYGDEVTVELT